MAEQEASQQYSWERPSDYRRVFSNHFNFRFAPGEGNITFSQFTETPGSPLQNQILEHINITMSWPQLQLLGEYLAVVIQEMEREFGPIVSLGIPKEELRKQALAVIKEFRILKK